MTSLRGKMAVLALLCVGLVVAVLGTRGGSATAVPAPDAPASIECPAGAPAQKDPAVVAAMNELNKWTTDPARNQIYLGQFPCHQTKTVVVYRLPGHPDLDAAARKVVEAHHARAAFADSTYAYAPLRAAADRIQADGPALAAQGIRIAWTLIDRGAVADVQVAVRGDDLDKARTALSKYGVFVLVRAA